jgi:hypothetical protein
VANNRGRRLQKLFCLSSAAAKFIRNRRARARDEVTRPTMVAGYLFT